MRRIVCAIAFLLVFCVFGAATPRTLRVDYYHTGNAHEEWFSLDRIVLEPLEWPGNPHHAIDQSQLGIYLFEVRETSSGELLYSRGFNSVFGEWKTTEEALHGNRTFSESLRFPAPDTPVEVLLKERGESGFHEVWKIAIDSRDKFIERGRPPSPGPLLELQKMGDPATKVDLLVLGDGYTAEERGKFEKDARRFMEVLFATSPFHEHRSEFNVWGLCPAAEESGVSRPSNGTRNVRLAMKAPDGPLPNVTRAIERLGVLVLPLPDFRDCDAFAVWAGPGREYPVIGIIGQKPPDRVRMSVAHELGHLVLHRSVASGTQELETHAYQFAAELLLPARTIVRDLTIQKLNLFRLAELKGSWGVSMQALSRRARELDVINDRQYRYLMKQLSLRGWRTDEPNLAPLAPERPRAIRKLGEVALGLSPNWKTVARDFALTDSFLSDLFQMSEPAPSARARTNSAPSHGAVLTFKRRA